MLNYGFKYLEYNNLNHEKWIKECAKRRSLNGANCNLKKYTNTKQYNKKNEYYLNLNK